MKKQNRTGSRLFFIEFLIVLFFFLIVSAVCLKLFAHAHQITERAEALSRGQAFAASIVEVLEAEAGDGTEEDLYCVLQKIWLEGNMETDRFVLSYDRTFEICEPENAYYTAVVSVKTESESPAVTIRITDPANEVLYELSVQLHLPLTYKEVLS